MSRSIIVLKDCGENEGQEEELIEIELIEEELEKGKEYEELIENVEVHVTCLDVLCKLCSCIFFLCNSDYFYKNHLL